MHPPYPIYRVRLNAPGGRPAQALEAMGSKEKVWLLNPKSGTLVMLKFSRDGSGEDWSEKASFEIARRLGVPCPRVELAHVESRPAVLCWDFLRNRIPQTRPGRFQRSLIHGNELLLRRDSSYPAAGSYRVSKHTVAAVHEALAGLRHAVRPGVLHSDQNDAFSAFVGYLLFDALIGNTDRHHENWAVITTPQGKRAGAWLAPSYDHASSLGRELNDDKRRSRLESTGRGTVEQYAEKARSAFWNDSGERRLTTFEALQTAGEERPTALERWVARLASVPAELLFAAIERIPDARLSATGKRFTRELLRYNRQRLVDLLK